MHTSFKEFLTEARKAGVNYQEERTKGVVTKVIAQLEGHEAGRLTKLAREYHKLSKALDKISKAKDERNKQLKELIGDTFDPEADKFYTRVMASAAFTATLAKETHPDDVAEKVEIAYEKLVDGLLKLIADELQPAAEELVEACTRKWKPDPRSPNLTVKPLDEGIAALAMSAVAGWWRGIKAKLAKHLTRFDKGLPKLEAQLEAYKALPKPSLGVEGAKADRKHKAVTTNESAGKFKTFVLEAPKGKKALSPLEQLKALPQPIGINGGAYTYWVDVTKSPLKFTASDGAVIDEANTLEDIVKWMDKWAADLWQEFLSGDEALELLRGENIVRIRKPNGRMDQEDHESQM